MTQPPHPPSGDPADEARVRHLLSTLPDPGPMPSDLVERITARLEDEGRRGAPAGATVVPFPVPDRRRAPSRRLIAGLSGAAAAAAIAGIVGLQAANAPVDSVVAALTTRSSASGRIHTGVSTTKYTAAALPGQAATLVKTASTAPPPPPLSAESPMTGPLGTESGVKACLSSLRLQGPAVVDMAFFEGKPAAVLVTGDDGHRQVRVVPRSCGNGDTTVVHGPVDLP